MTAGRPGDGSYQDPYGEDPYGENPYGRDSHGRDGHGQEAYGQNAYGQDPYGQDPYGARDAYEQGAYGGRSYGGESYGSEPDGQSAWDPDPYAYPYEQRRGPDYQAAFDALSDPLTDPLPSSGASGAVTGSGHDEESVSPWFRPTREQGHAPGTGQPGAHPPQGGHPQQHHSRHPQAPAQQPDPQALQQQQQQRQHPQQHPQQTGVPQARQQPPRPAGRRGPADVGETAALPAVESPPSPEPAARRRRRPGPGSDADPGAAAADRAGPAEDESRTVALRRPSEEELGGRAARRRAAAGKGKGGRAAAASGAPARAMTRLEARRAARAAKDGPVVLLSRAIGETFITCGVLMLLFVAYQLWWTNILAHNYAGGARDSLTQQWEENPERKPGAFSPGQGFAIMYIPKLDVVVPVAQGIGKQSVLDNGLVGHYDKASGVPTAMPWDKQGNFGVAGHRNTHGEPFRYVNRLVAGDKIIIETAEKYFVYEMYSRLPSTSPSNTSVLDPVPPQSGFEEPGRYITLTTCTPEFTSKYRLIIWGRMVDERPRSEGKPDALV